MVKVILEQYIFHRCLRVHSDGCSDFATEGREGHRGVWTARTQEISLQVSHGGIRVGWVDRLSTLDIEVERRDRRPAHVGPESEYSPESFATRHLTPSQIIEHLILTVSDRLSALFGDEGPHPVRSLRQIPV
eukprot:gene17935-biopygen10279